jgi:hypothetical protein
MFWRMTLLLIRVNVISDKTMHCILTQNWLSDKDTRLQEPVSGVTDGVREPETLNCNSILTWLITQEDFIAFKYCILPYYIHSKCKF